MLKVRTHMMRSIWTKSVGVVALTLLISFSVSSINLTPSVQASAKRVFVFNPLISSQNYDYRFQNLMGLLAAEGFDVTYRDYMPEDPALGGYDAYIHFAVTWESQGTTAIDKSRVANVRFLQYVRQGAGYLIMPSHVSYSNSERYSEMISYLGVISEATNEVHTTVSNFIQHELMKDIRSIYVRAAPLSLVSSDVYPLVVMNSTTWETGDKVVMISRDLDYGRVVVSGFSGMSDGDFGLWSRNDNALLFKNIVYWITKQSVPEHTRDIPALLSLEDSISKLNNSYSRVAGLALSIESQLQNISSQLTILRSNLSTLPEFSEMKRTLTELNSTVNQIIVLQNRTQQETKSLSEQLIQLGNADRALREEVSKVQSQMLSPQLIYTVTGLAVVLSIVAIALTFTRKAK